MVTSVVNQIVPVLHLAQGPSPTAWRSPRMALSPSDNTLAGPARPLVAVAGTRAGWALHL